jgi:hypothetical protein
VSKAFFLEGAFHVGVQGHRKRGSFRGRQAGEFGHLLALDLWALGDQEGQAGFGAAGAAIGEGGEIAFANNWFS